MGMSLADFFSRTDSTMLRDAQVVDVSAHKEKREINVTARFDKLAAFSDIKGMQSQISSDYALNKVIINPRYQRAFRSGLFGNLTEYIWRSIRWS